MRVKQSLSQEIVANLLEHVQFIGVCSELILIEFQSRLVDTKMKQGAINQHAKRIKESAAMVQTHLSSLTYNKDRQFFQYEYAPQLYRVLKYFMGLEVGQLEEFMDKIEEMQANGELKGNGKLETV